MIHRAARSFWEAFGSLDPDVQGVARKAFQLLKENPRHPSLHFKKVGRVWAARVGLKHRALAIEKPYGMLWLWIGTHAAYDYLGCEIKHAAAKTMG